MKKIIKKIKNFIFSVVSVVISFLSPLIKRIINFISSSFIISFIKILIKKIAENEVMPLAAELTYSMIFSLFPFIIFLISLVGYFNIETAYFIEEVFDVFPLQVAEVIDSVISETVDTRNPNILSSSLMLAIFSATGGFRAIMRGINKIYQQHDSRHIIKRWAYSGLMVFALALGIISTLFMVIFGDVVHGLLLYIVSDSPWLDMAFGIIGFALTITMMLAIIIFIYRLSSCRKMRIITLLPGAVLTLGVWMISSQLFNFYVNNFSRHSLIYGSIASIFLTMLWLNIIAATILIGAQTNAILNLGMRKIECGAGKNE
ncbi:MAG: YihY/virulence factor BrkB family protein [Defluviitaleaceae bacterium]|nr:YihY/virulence factor BrkB family protein [Defluviitaleaceae bacterium]